MGYPLFSGMPSYGNRIYYPQIKRTRWPAGSNTRGSNEEIVTTELGQIGTQIDGFGHQSIGNSHYQDTLERQDLTLETGDTVIINTGFWKLWEVDNERYYRSRPGIGVEAAEWLAS